MEREQERIKRSDSESTTHLSSGLADPDVDETLTDEDEDDDDDAMREETERIREEVEESTKKLSLKDANDVLIYDKDLLFECLENAEPYPIRGLFQFSDFWSEVEACVTR